MLIAFFSCHILSKLLRKLQQHANVISWLDSWCSCKAIKLWTWPSLCCVHGNGRAQLWDNFVRVCEMVGENQIGEGRKYIARAQVIPMGFYMFRTYLASSFFSGDFVALQETSQEGYKSVRTNLIPICKQVCSPNLKTYGWIWMEWSSPYFPGFVALVLSISILN